MGNDFASSEQSKAKFLLQYTRAKEYKDSQLGNLVVYTKTSDPSIKVVVKTFNTKSGVEFQNISKHFQQRVKYDQENLIKVINFYQEKGKEFCSDNSTVMVVLPFYEDTLDSELQQRFVTQQKYGESHLWLLIQQLVNPCFYLQERNLYMGDIRPKNIYLDQNGAVKIADFTLIPDNRNGFFTTMMGKDRAYLSPLLINAIKNKENRPENDKFKSDVFSLGMTLLESATLQSTLDLYNFDQYTINFVEIDRRLKVMRLQGLSNLITNFVKECLQEDEAARPSFIELKQVVDNFQQQILNMEPFYQSTIRPVSQPQVHYYGQVPQQSMIQPLTQQTLSQTQSQQTLVQQQSQYPPLQQQTQPLVQQQQQQNIIQNPPQARQQYQNNPQKQTTSQIRPSSPQKINYNQGSNIQHTAYNLNQYNQSVAFPQQIVPPPIHPNYNINQSVQPQIQAYAEYPVPLINQPYPYNQQPSPIRSISPMPQNIQMQQTSQFKPYQGPQQYQIPQYQYQNDLSDQDQRVQNAIQSSQEAIQRYSKQVYAPNQ